MRHAILAVVVSLLCGTAFSGVTVTMSKQAKNVKRAVAAERVVSFLLAHSIDLATAEAEGCPGYMVQDWSIMATAHAETVDLGATPAASEVRQTFLALPDDSGALKFYANTVASCSTRTGCDNLADTLAGYLNLAPEDVQSVRHMGGSTCFVQMKKGEAKAKAALVCD